MKEPIVVFQKLPRGICGIHENGFVIIDLLKDDNPAITFIHEMLHHRYPDWKEKKVEAMSLAVWRKYGQKERFLIYKKLFNRQFKSEADDG